MKNFILILVINILTLSGLSAQTYTTGTVTFFANFSGKIDVNSTTVTVTLVGPNNSWLGIGFDATTMDDVGQDVVIFDGTAITDRSFNGTGVIPPTDTQNWTLVSNLNNTPTTGNRTVTMTRPRVASEGTDYTFPLAAQPLNILFARRTGSTTIGYHGSGNCGATTVNLTLGRDGFKPDAFKMYPNPSKEYVTIELPQQVNTGEMKIYDNLGRVVRKQTITQSENKIETGSLTSGTYMIVLRTEYGNVTKNLVID
ncbi:T9SS type A sorting domain-containing protein [Flavobacterium amnicola]|uniref:T9SS type A sorting domain-containing protein n=1 Tax=Flavobacterium amnicola TaxID=2506422 RepID=A0A4Q1K0K2_9FLAO|nr:T9SS type A sorting domain-containing protein [Flavobacterium amnicola]RXR17720.1 T9SS type A sorting domain-containing protein [Flavobacterium amnicola]